MRKTRLAVYHSESKNSTHLVVAVTMKVKNKRKLTNDCPIKYININNVQ